MIMQVDQIDFHGLLHSANLVETELRKKLAPLGVQPRQALVLEAMSRMGPVSQVELAATFGVSAASMSTMTERLLAAGYLTRSVDPASRRSNILELTDNGRTLLDGIVTAWSEVDAVIKAVLGEDAPALFNLARQLRNGLGGKIPGTDRANSGEEV
ncbi:MarR family winged helix-turn-helix transcriptional regulator [Roseibium sp.]|uniref:MarR family winged helix-turn-helix transcriptional regulator n=2 Tax=Alphaproteobacteria TaxID=28211 RepID=UPI0032671B52